LVHQRLQAASNDKLSNNSTSKNCQRTITKKPQSINPEWKADICRARGDKDENTLQTGL